MGHAAMVARKGGMLNREEYHRAMGTRRFVIAILALVVAAGAAGAADAHGGGGVAAAHRTKIGRTLAAPPSSLTPGLPESAALAGDQRTYPQVRPERGGRLTLFTLEFTLREAPGHENLLASDYRVQITAPPAAAQSCEVPQPPPIESGEVGEMVQIPLQPPPRGWCTGTYRATVYLEQGPYCPPPVQGQLPTPCPEFATRALDTGTVAFSVVDPGTGRNARVVGEVRVCNAPGNCLTRSFDVSAIDSEENVIAEAPTFGADNRYRLRVPAGHYALLATSDGLSCRGSVTAEAHLRVISNITCLVP